MSFNREWKGGVYKCATRLFFWMQSHDNDSSDRLQTLSRFFFGWFGGCDGDRRRRNLIPAPPRCFHAASPPPLLPRLLAMTLSDRFDQMEAKRVIVKPGDIYSQFFTAIPPVQRKLCCVFFRFFPPVFATQTVQAMPTPPRSSLRVLHLCIAKEMPTSAGRYIR